jgi:uncharacterized tellurite resistance protein B-like protein
MSDPISFAQLTTDERLALVGLLKIVIEADKRFGLKEAAALQQVAEQVGRREFNQLTDQARARFLDRDALKRHVATIERPEARALIFRTATQMASADSVLAPEEQELLSWLAAEWGLAQAAG